MSEKKFFGNAKVISTKYGQIVKLGFTVNDLQEMLSLAQSNPRGWTNLSLMTSQGGKMYMELDTFDQQNTGQQSPPAPAQWSSQPQTQAPPQNWPQQTQAPPQNWPQQPTQPQQPQQQSWPAQQPPKQWGQ